MAEGQSTALQTRSIATGQLPTVLRVELITPRGVVAHDDTDALTAPGEGGEFELLPGHVPMMTALKPGVLIIGDRKRVRYAVSSGYLRIDPANSGGGYYPGFGGSNVISNSGNGIGNRVIAGSPYGYGGSNFISNSGNGQGNVIIAR